jgi:DNA topoisomerase-1
VDLGSEGPAGLITYMRTDSVKVADEAVRSVRSYIGQQFGAPYLPEAPRAYKSKKSAQEAHEAVRPTSVERSPEALRSYLTEEQFNLYQLVWQRFVASQMGDAVDQHTAVRIDAGPYELRARGRRNLFAGWTQVYRDADEKDKADDKDKAEDAVPESMLPPLAAGDALSLLGCIPGQHFTKPPRRFTDASLVKTLEELGIGRPSTYAPILQTIIERNYVERQGGSLTPTSLGRTVTDMLIEHFPEVMDAKFTAEMESELDRVEDGELEWVGVVRDFYTPFAGRVSAAQEQMREVKREVVPTKYVCEKCQRPMVIKWGRFGQFMSCSGFPECKNAKAIPTGVPCPQPDCGGELTQRGARGRKFFGCSTYPACTYTTRKLPSAPEPASQPPVPPANPGAQG